MKRCTLTAKLTKQIVASIRSGSYGHVAARAWGVPRKVYERWLKKGRERNAPKPYATFANEVETALAQARVLAEINAFKKDARAWLEHGPGREKLGNPGWTGAVKPAGAAARKALNFFALPEFMDMCRRLMESLAPFPEARTRAAESLIAMADAERRKREPKNINDSGKPGSKPRRGRGPHAENTSWSAPEDGLEPTLTLLRDIASAAGDGTEARTTTTSPPAVLAAEPG